VEGTLLELQGLVMRAQEFLIEYNQQATIKNFGPKLLAVANRDKSYRKIQRLRTTPEQFQIDDRWLPDILTRLESADPTPHKEYSQALAKLYTRGDTKMEDVVSTIAQYLAKFHRLKLKKAIQPPYNDFNRYQSFNDFMQAVDGLQDIEPNYVNKGQAEEVYRDRDLRIIKPLNQDAACYYGQGTRWCTAATQGDNQFNYYSKSGPLYIILPTRAAYPGEKYQFHFNSKQFMNEQDQQINSAELMARYPQLRTVFAKDAAESNAYTFMYEPAELKLRIDRAIPRFINTVLRELTEQAKPLARNMIEDLVYEIRFLKGFKQELTELAQDDIEQNGKKLVQQAAKILARNPDLGDDEDGLADALDEFMTDWIRDQEFWAYISDLFEDHRGLDNDLLMGADLSTKGSISSALVEIIGYTWPQLMSMPLDQR
jgi:hypothetical protein